MTGLINLELFVASPGDVSKERESVRKIVTEITRTIGPVLEIDINTFLWEHDLGPGLDAGGAQAYVDANSNLKKCDILVGIFWNRLGTPTPDGTTGTEHEFRVSYDRWKQTGAPHVMMYFSQKPIKQTPDNLDQAGRLLKFRNALPADAFIGSYKTPQHFEKQFREHLTKHVMKVWSERGRPVDPVQFAGSSLKLGMITTSDALIQANADIVSEAREVFYCTGSRSRDAKYLKAIEDRLTAAPELVHYRVLIGPPYRALLKDHLLKLLTLRSPTDRTLGFQTLFLGVFEQPMKQAEVFIAGNEKRALIVLPSRQGLGEYNTALVIDDREHVKDLRGFVRQLYAASRRIETSAEVAQLSTVLHDMSAPPPAPTSTTRDD